MQIKMIFLLVLICLFNQGILFSQIDSILASKFIVDFAVPDEPAFKLLEVEESNILRPASVRDFAVQLSDFLTSNGELSIPSTFGLELSPGLLINGKNLSLADYQQNAVFYRLRISAATSKITDSTSARKFAFGIRTSIIDKSDLRTNTEFLNKQTLITRQIVKIRTAIRKAQGLEGEIILDDTSRAKIDSLKNELDNLINKEKESYADNNWNRRFLDIALGSYGVSEDSSGNGFVIQSVSGWVTYAEGFKTNWLQLLLGTRLSNSLDSLQEKRSWEGSFSGRLYLGNNTYKFFLEGQASGKEKNLPEWLLNFGGEANILNSVWFEFTSGFNFEGKDKQAELVTDFNLKLSLTDLFNE
jgi:hypothetical protein